MNQDLVSYEAPSSVSMSVSQERTWSMICHLSSLSGFMIPLGNVLGPLVVWLIKKDSSAMVDRHGKDALNFHLSMMIYVTVALSVTMASLLIPIVGWLFAVVVGLPVVAILSVLDLVYTIIAAVKAADGKEVRYPLVIRFFNT